MTGAKCKVLGPATRWSYYTQTPAWGYNGWAPVFAYWTQATPQFNVTFQNANGQVPNSGHGTTIQCAMMDGSVKQVTSSVSQATWWAACTPAGSDILGSNW